MQSRADVCSGLPAKTIPLLWLAVAAGLSPNLKASALDTPPAKAGVPAVGQPGTNLAARTNVLDDYAGSASCQPCHADEFRDWRRSHHALAERELEASSDNAAFVPGRSFTIGTQTTTVHTNDTHYALTGLGLDGARHTWPVARILGDTPLRQMLIAFPGGRLQAAEVAWDPRSNQWFDVYGNEDRQPGEWGQWLGRGMNWNSQCAVCHNTRLDKHYQAATDSYQTTLVEHGVGCEACHGPMLAHNLWQRAHRGQALADPTIRALSRDQLTDTCGGCHSRRAELTGPVTPGANY